MKNQIHILVLHLFLLLTNEAAFHALFRRLFPCNQRSVSVVNAELLLDNAFDIPGLDRRPVFAMKGDINIGGVLSLTSSSTTGTCSGKTSTFGWQLSEMVSYAVKYVNGLSDLLPNVTLGFTIVDDCFQSNVGITSSLVFLPPALQSCDNSSTATSCRKEKECSSSDQFDVIGIIGPLSSSTTVPISSLYALAKLPVVGFLATSDALSDKGEHPYFFRVVPPDKHQVEAMLKFISDNDWSYISVVYSKGAYGEKAFDNIKENIDRYNLCIATSHRLLGSGGYDVIAKDLIRHSRARVVILFISSPKRLFSAIENQGFLNHFIWIGSDASSYSYELSFGKNSQSSIGAFSFSPYMRYIPSFYDYINKLNVETSTNPFIKDAFELMTECSFANKTCDLGESASLSTRFVNANMFSLAADVVLTFAHAADDLLRATCPEARGLEARACITRELFISHLKNVSFEGFTSHVEFDEFNDVKGKYEIRQLSIDGYDGNDEEGTPLSQTGNQYNSSEQEVGGLVGRVIGVYDGITRSITYSLATNISWSHSKRLDRLVALAHDERDDGRPESACSKPCLENEVKIEKELWCCWDCHACRDNEIIVTANSTCQACPALTWPEPESGYTTCSFIPPTYPKIVDSLPIVLVCIAFIAISVTIFVIIAYVRFRNERVIKAASRELSFVQLVAILLGYVTVIEFQLKPSDVMCKLMYFLFCMTFALLYCPLLVKAVRIYRIFRSATKDNRRPRFVSQQSQLVMSFILIAIQVVLCVVTTLAFDPSSRLNQPVWSERLVELSCDLTVPGLTSFLTFNLVLVILCSILAFKTRKLPDNFNESRFISLCVFTTLIIWLAFIPTYYTANRVFVRSLLLSMSLLLNHSVALLFLFVPKLYAVIYVSVDQMNFVTTRFQPTQHNLATTIHTRSTASNQVAPMR